MSTMNGIMSNSSVVVDDRDRAVKDPALGEHVRSPISAGETLGRTTFFSQPHRKSSGELLLLSSAVSEGVVGTESQHVPNRIQYSLAWLMQRSHITSAACFIYGYISSIMLLSSLKCPACESLSSRLMYTFRSSQGPMAMFWIGQMSGAFLSWLLSDGQGRSRSIFVISLLLSATLFLMSFVPHELMVDTSAWFAHPPEGATHSTREVMEEEVLHLTTTFLTGLCSSALFIITITFVTEVSKTKSRGYEIAKALRFVVVGTIVALIVLISIATWSNGGFQINYDASALKYWRQSSHYVKSQTLDAASISKKILNAPPSLIFAPLRVRITFLVPALMSLYVAAGIFFQPDSPYWLMAYKTPFDCIKSLRISRGANDVGAEYVSIYRCLSREACRDASWLAFVSERPMRYLLLLCASVGALRILSGIGLVMVHCDVFLRLAGFYSFVESGAMKDECTADYPLHYTYDNRRRLMSVDGEDVHYHHYGATATASSSKLVSGADLGLFIIASIAVSGVWTGTRFLRRNGSRRLLLFTGILGMFLSMLVAGSMLSGSGALRLLNADVVHSLSKLVSKKTLPTELNLPPPSASPAMVDDSLISPLAGNSDISQLELSSEPSESPSHLIAVEPSFSPTLSATEAERVKSVSENSNSTLDNTANASLVLDDSYQPPKASSYPRLSSFFDVMSNQISKNDSIELESSFVESAGTASATRRRLLATITDPAITMIDATNQQQGASATAPLPDFFIKDADSEKYTILRQIVFAACISVFVFCFFGSIFLLNWIIIPESFPLRMRAKGLSMIFGSQLVAGLIFDYSYAWCGGDAYYSITRSAVSIHFGGTDAANSDSSHHKLVCFDEWIDTSDLSVMPSLAELMVMCALVSLIVGAFLFLALPETHHVSLADVEDVYDVSEYDLYFGCCPHGKGAGYLGLRGSIFVDHIDSTSEVPDIAGEEDTEFWGSRRVSDSELFAEEDDCVDEEAHWDGIGHLTATEEEISMAQLNFLPTAAFSTYREALARKRHRDPAPQSLVASLWYRFKALFSTDESNPSNNENTRLLRKKSLTQKTSRNSSRASLKGNSAIWDSDALASANLELSISSNPSNTPQRNRGGSSNPTDADERGRGGYGSTSRTDINLEYSLNSGSNPSASIALGSIVAADIDNLIPGGTSSDSLRSGRSTPASFTTSQSLNAQRHKYSGSMSAVQFQYDN